jgi:hypothetical protein
VEIILALELIVHSAASFSHAAIAFPQGYNPALCASIRRLTVASEA